MVTFMADGGFRRDDFKRIGDSLMALAENLKDHYHLLGRANRALRMIRTDAPEDTVLIAFTRTEMTIHRAALYHFRDSPNLPAVIAGDVRYECERVDWARFDMEPEPSETKS